MHRLKKDVPEVVDMKTLKNREIADKFNNGWEPDTVKGVEKSDEFAVFYQSPAPDLNKKDYVVDKTGVLFPKKYTLDWVK